MQVFAQGTIVKIDEVPAYVEEENAAVLKLKASGVMTAAYRRRAGPGVLIMLEADSIADAEKEMEALPFIEFGIMTLEYDEIYSI